MMQNQQERRTRIESARKMVIASNFLVPSHAALFIRFYLVCFFPFEKIRAVGVRKFVKFELLTAYFEPLMRLAAINRYMIRYPFHVIVSIACDM